MTAKRKVGQHLGMRDYATILAAVARIPSSAARLASHQSASVLSLRRILGMFHALGLVHIHGFVNESRGTPSAVYAAGPGVDAVMPPTRDGLPSKALKAVSRRVPLRSNVIAFASVVRALEQGLTIREMVDETGQNDGALRRLVRYMHEAGMVHICEWQRSSTGYPAAVYRLGRRVDARYPRPMTVQERSARSWAGRKARLEIMRVGHALAGSSEMVPVRRAA